MFTPRKINFSEINGGARYVDGNEVSPEAINRPIEASAYAQNKAERALELITDAVGTKVTLSAYPVGSIYMSINSTSPAELFGGTWEALTNRFLLGSGTNTIGATGGVNELKLRAAIGNFNSTTNALGWKVADAISGVKYNYGGTFSIHSTDVIGNKIRHGVPVYDIKQGSDTISVLPPFLVVNMWKRIA
jgi:hypothetical protein